MYDHRPFETLGRFGNDWLDARYHFSFANYYDPKRTQWGALRVWNDDRIRPQRGFAPHSHADMEIITYVRTGAITHEDSMGNRGRTAAGDVQVMSAGAGVTHAEFNLEDEDTTLFQIWIEPKTRGGAPSWGAAKFPEGERAGRFVTLASGYADDQAAGALPLRAEARVLAANAPAGAKLTQPLKAGQRGYLVVDQGEVSVDGRVLKARDGLGVAGVDALTIEVAKDAKLVLVETV